MANQVKERLDFPELFKLAAELFRVSLILQVRQNTRGYRLHRTTHFDITNKECTTWSFAFQAFFYQVVVHLAVVETSSGWPTLEFI